MHLATGPRVGARPLSPLSRRTSRPLQHICHATAQGQEPRGLGAKAPLASAPLRQALDPEADLQVAQSRFPGALATITLGAGLLSERLDGCGFVQQLEINEHVHPYVLGLVAAGLAVAAVWPRRRLQQEDGIDMFQDFAGRIAFAGLAGAIAGEMATGKGLLALLEVETGVEALSEVEAVLAFLVCLILTRPHSRRA